LDPARQKNYVDQWWLERVTSRRDQGAFFMPRNVCDMAVRMVFYRGGLRRLALQPRRQQVGELGYEDVQSFCLLANRQIARTVDHGFALSSPALLSASSQNRKRLMF
jgi:hypothetical protein